MQPKHTPLTDDELDYLDSILNQFKNEEAMNMEKADGFFTVLICSPELTMPSNYLPEVFGGGSLSDCEAMNSLGEAEKFMGLLMQHWNEVSARLRNEEVFIPLIFENDDGTAQGNDWAKGFLRGMALHQDDWNELLNDENQGGYLVPIMALAHEHDPDPKLRPYQEPISTERRKTLLAGLAAGAMGIFKYFETHRQGDSKHFGRYTPFIRTTPKIGRNEPCPCGSGRKFKICCGNITLN